MRTTIMWIAAGTAMLAACGEEVGCPGGDDPKTGKCKGEEASESTPSQVDAGVPADDRGDRESIAADGGSFVDLVDGSSPTSAQDASSCIPGAQDAIDDLGFDANCDGVDGLREEHLFVTPSGDDEAAGSENFPLRTIAKALSRAASEGRKGVLLAAGTYEECELNLGVSGVRLFGGYLPTGAKWNARDIYAPSVIRTSNAGVRLTGLKSDSVLEAVSIEAASADEPEFCAPTMPEPPGGRSSVGLTISSNERTLPSVVLRHTRVLAGAGGMGAPGAPGDAGDARSGDDAGNGVAGCPGGPGCPQLSGTQEYRTTPAPDRPRCEITARLNAGSGGGSRWYGQSGGGGGTAGGPVGYPPGAGMSGTSGKAGSHGAGGTELGTYSLDGYSPKFAAAGTRGQVGEGGGGGGGADDARTTVACPANSSATTSTPPPSSGGSGGTGGCGGHGGSGAQGGGASIGVIVDDLTLILEEAHVEASSGGRGGRGGIGGRAGGGGMGGRGGNSACGDWGGKTWVSTAGGRGGDGGAGGDGGYGGGGMGGPSVGVLVIGRAQVDAPDGSIVAGKAGLSGLSGGSSGAVGTSQILLKQN